MQIDQELDARKLGCFMLTLRTRQALDKLQTGQILRVITHDPGSVHEFRSFASLTGHELISSDEANGEQVFLLKKH